MKKFTIINLLVFALICTSFGQNEPKQPRETLEWTVMQSWEIPGKASGLAWDGTFIYYGIYGSDGDHVYKFDPSDGSTQIQFIASGIEDSYGMTWDGSNLWTTDHVTSPSIPALAIELDLSGNIISSFDLPDHYMSGIAYDEGNFWVGTYYPDPGTIYNITDAGGIISQFTPPSDQIWDICMQDNDLWMVDYNSNMIYKTDASGNILESHACENIKPSGIIFDGTYLWYVDGPLSSPSTLYKINLSGSGTPEINIPIISHNYGSVTIGNSETWEMEVENIGNVDLEITNLLIPGSAPIFTTFNPPQIITPGNSIFIPLTYTPSEIGPLNVTVTVASSDPITSTVDITLSGEAVSSGPTIYVPFNAHDYTDVRMNAFTRWFLEIDNIGDETLTISDIASNEVYFTIDESVSFPLDIASLDSTLIGVWFNPVQTGNYNAELTIENNDESNNPYVISLNGEGVSEAYPTGTPLWSYMIDNSYDNSPKAISPIKDITGDGVSEVIICSEDDFVRCFNGNSSGIADVMWEVEISGGTTYDQSGLTTVEDLDGDGFEDLILGTVWADRSITAFSGKTGNQIWKHDTHEYGDGGWVYAVDASHDYNGDGVKDVLACTGDDSSDTGPLRVYCLNGLDGISIWERYIGGPVFSVLGVEDFTGDDIPDVIAGASNADETQGRIYGIDGSDGSIKWTKNTSGSSVWALLQLDDITGDGVKDIIAGDFGGNYYYINPVNNSQIHQGSIYGALILRFEKLEDVNSDGFSDVLVEHSKTNGVVLNGYDGSNIWIKPLADKSWNVAVINDITGDDINDVIIGTLFGNNYCYYLDGVDGEEIESINYPTPIDALNTIPDIVGDGTMEVVVGGRNGLVYCYSGGLGDPVNIEEISGFENSEISSNYPNPFTEQTTISFNLDQRSFVTLSIYDLNGMVVKTLIDESMTSGKHTVIWNGMNTAGQELHPGFYIYELTTEMGRFRKKIVKI